MVIWKYPLQLTDQQEVMMPVGAEILTAKMQGGTVCLWAIVTESNLSRPRDIRIIGTGNPFHEDIEYWSAREFIGTVIDSDRGLVWHIFERTE
jgi:hypothetical protein